MWARHGFSGVLGELALALAGMLAAGASAAGAPAAGASAAGSPAFDARLSGYGYPFEVRHYGFRAQEQDLEMAYMDVQAPERNGHTVLLLHGKNFSGAYWGRTIEALTDAGYRVIAPDQIGFGKSNKPSGFQYSFHALASHTRRLLDHRDVEEVRVVGHSMGGMLAARFALMHPEVTERLTLVNPIGLEDWKAKGVPYTPVGERYRSELDKTPEGVKAYMRGSYFGGEWQPAYDPLVTIQSGWIRGPDWDRLAWVSALAYDMIFTQPVVHEFPRLDVPTQLIIGQRDRTALGTDKVADDLAAALGDYPALGRQAAERIPDARLVALEGVGHVPHFEAWDRFIESLTGFLEGAQ
ncbi:alpha/beta fold hydrolase [Thiohalorhabdus sp.]|uniref:alpha/beta fold hydrolase n=1 Tax=Thiohalorhabdus sp. TaxID=3094134 RepID=UPI002FC2EA35